MPLPTGRPRARLPGNVAAILSAKYLPPAPIAGLHVDLGVLGRDLEVHGHRHVAFAARPGGDGVAHAVDDLADTARTRRISGSSRIRIKERF